MALRLQLAFATGLGLGHAPIASGTFGSLPGLLLVWWLYPLGGHLAVLAALVVVVAVGVPAASAAERHYGVSDPGEVVVDEIAGQMLTLLFVPPTPAALVAGFLLFRLSDIVKPPPARRLESLTGGSGIMADDLAAALYANVLLHGLFWVAPGLMGA